MHSEHFVHKSMEVIKDCVVKSASMVYMTAFKKGTFSFCLCQVYKHKILIPAVSVKGAWGWAVSKDAVGKP